MDTLGLVLLDSEPYLNLVFLQAPLTLLWWVMEMPPHYCEVRVEVQVLYSAFIDQGWGEGSLGAFYH